MPRIPELPVPGAGAVIVSGMALEEEMLLFRDRPGALMHSRGSGRRRDYSFCIVGNDLIPNSTFGKAGRDGVDFLPQVRVPVGGGVGGGSRTPSPCLPLPIYDPQR